MVSENDHFLILSNGISDKAPGKPLKIRFKKSYDTPSLPPGSSFPGSCYSPPSVAMDKVTATPHPFSPHIGFLKALLGEVQSSRRKKNRTNQIQDQGTGGS